MSARALRALIAGVTPAVLATLALAAPPALATEVDIDEGTDRPSSVDIFDGDDNRDVITVTISGANVVVVDTGPGGVAPANADCTAVNAATVTCPLDPPDAPPPADPFRPIGFVDYDGGGGNDEAVINAALAASDLEGGPGDDKLVGAGLVDDLEGDEGNDQVFGNGGNDSVEGMTGNDALSGGEGDDSMSDGGSETETGGTDVLDGGPGFDFTNYSRTLPVSVSFDSVANDGFPGEADNVLGIEGAGAGREGDTLIGDGAANVFFAGPGDDTIRGLGGRDQIDASDGDDTVSGGAGPDGISCGAGVDTAVVDPSDVFGLGGSGIIRTRGPVLVDCESTGAVVGPSDTALVKKGAVKVPVSCPAEEAEKCQGKVKLLLNGKSLGKGKFKVAPGKTKNAKVKLSKKGKKTLKSFGGSALVKAEVSTKLAGENSVTSEDVLIR